MMPCGLLGRSDFPVTTEGGSMRLGMSNIEQNAFV